MTLTDSLTSEREWRLTPLDASPLKSGYHARQFLLGETPYSPTGILRQALASHEWEKTGLPTLLRR